MLPEPTITDINSRQPGPITPGRIQREAILVHRAERIAAVRAGVGKVTPDSELARAASAPVDGE